MWCIIVPLVCHFIVSMQHMCIVYQLDFFIEFLQQKLVKKMIGINHVNEKYNAWTINSNSKEPYNRCYHCF